MKFLPVKYRKSQSDWFGKRGISWHVSVVARKINGRYGSQRFVHMVETTSQDSSVVVRIIEHTLRSLKEENPGLDTALLRQDNAGCYHNSAVIASCSLIKLNTGVSVRRVDFSDPQGGKGACNRKAATIKAHVRRYVNEGHDVQNAKELKNSHPIEWRCHRGPCCCCRCCRCCLRTASGETGWCKHVKQL